MNEDPRGLCAATDDLSEAVGYLSEAACELRSGDPDTAGELASMAAQALVIAAVALDSEAALLTADLIRLDGGLD